MPSEPRGPAHAAPPLIDCPNCGAPIPPAVNHKGRDAYLCPCGWSAWADNVDLPPQVDRPGHEGCLEHVRFACVDCHGIHVRAAEAEGVTYQEWAEARGVIFPDPARLGVGHVRPVAWGGAA